MDALGGLQEKDKHSTYQISYEQEKIQLECPMKDGNDKPGFRDAEDFI